MKKLPEPPFEANASAQVQSACLCLAVLTMVSGADPAPAACRMPSPDAVQLEQRVNWCDRQGNHLELPLQAAP